MPVTGTVSEAGAVLQLLGPTITIAILFTIVLVYYFKYYKPRRIELENEVAKLNVKHGGNPVEIDFSIILSELKGRTDDLSRDIEETKRVVNDNDDKVNAISDLMDIVNDLDKKVKDISKLCGKRGEQIVEVLSIVNTFKERFADINEKLRAVEKNLFDVLLHRS
jgi:predicted  nucleic acid-binding Zn-ribbon protein